MSWITPILFTIAALLCGFISGNSVTAILFAGYISKRYRGTDRDVADRNAGRMLLLPVLILSLSIIFLPIELHHLMSTRDVSCPSFCQACDPGPCETQRAADLQDCLEVLDALECEGPPDHVSSKDQETKPQ